MWCCSANPTARLDPLSFHPSGSNSEQIIAGERSKVDPLQLVRQQQRAHTQTETGDTPVKEGAEESGANTQTRVSETKNKQQTKDETKEEMKKNGGP